MKRTFLVSALLLITPLALGHSALPLNAYANGGFEAGWAGWSVHGTGDVSGPTLVTPGADGSLTAMTTPEVGAGSGWVYQDVTPLAASPIALLDFHARIDGNLANPYPQGIAVVADHDVATGLSKITASVRFANGQGELVVYCNGFLLPCTPVTFAPPNDGAWHHYQVIVVGPIGYGVLLVDGVAVVAYTNGDPASVAPPERLLFGDLAYHVRGLAPDVSWDEIYFGPAI